MPKQMIGILTAGGDCPGLNAAIRGVGKAANALDMGVIGFLDGFHGLVENRFIRLDSSALSGILTVGGTILGTSRDKPYKMPVGDEGKMDMTPLAVANYHEQHLDCLVCLGGDGTMKNAYHLAKEGLNVVTLPKTIDNDVALTDVTFGFDTAMAIATEAIDRLHSTAESHHRVIIVETMGHSAGWLALGSGVAGGADVILIPEIPYDIDLIAEAVLGRSRRGKRFSIVALAEGAISQKRVKKLKKKGKKRKPKSNLSRKVARKLEKRTGLVSRVTSLGYLQRGGTPTATDRMLATQLGTACAKLIHEEHYNVMVALQNGKSVPVPLEEVAGKRRTVPQDHPWIESARMVGTSFGSKDFQP
jgi:6-phosphofructokinase 1